MTSKDMIMIVVEINSEYNTRIKHYDAQGVLVVHETWILDKTDGGLREMQLRLP